MTAPPITFRNTSTDPVLEAAVRREADRLGRFFDRIVSCRVVIEGPRRQEYGGLFHVRIDLGLLKSGVQRGIVLHDEFFTGNTFDEMRRQLQDYARRLRPRISAHGAPHRPAGHEIT